MSRKVAKKWITSKLDELAVAEGCYFDIEAGQRVIAFVETFCHHSKGQFAGQRFILLDWQRTIILRLYGWKRPNGRRRFRQAYIEIPKKNGKTTLLAALSLYHLIADGEAGAECYCVATNRKQAKLVFDEAMNMVNASPELSKHLETSEFYNHIKFPATNSILRPMSADGSQKSGDNISFLSFDEFHDQKNSVVFDTLQFAGRARAQPLMILITTAGFDRQSICYKQRQHAEKVLAGEGEDTAYFACLFKADPEDPIDDPKIWRKCNPSMGFSIDEESFALEYKSVCEQPGQLNNWLRFSLNIWTSSETRFLRRDQWDSCKGTIDLAKLNGQKCWCGYDGSFVSDLTAFVLLFKLDGKFVVVPHFWAPKDRAKKRERLDRVPYEDWRKNGHIRLHDGDALNPDDVFNEIIEIIRPYKVQAIFADPYRASNIGLRLKGEGLPVEFFRQGFLSMAEPTSELERLVISGGLVHNHPILDWNADNAMVDTDNAGNQKLVKGKRREKDDGIVALVMAIAAASRDVKKTSVYAKGASLFL